MSDHRALSVRGSPFPMWSRPLWDGNLRSCCGQTGLPARLPGWSHRAGRQNLAAALDAFSSLLGRQARKWAAGNPSLTTTLGSFMSYKDRLRIDADGMTLIRKYICKKCSDGALGCLLVAMSAKGGGCHLHLCPATRAYRRLQVESRGPCK